eukprot:scpid31882/ scgid29858/ E3 ubiquitin-protein ligase TRAF7; RING finger and WD repeat-containing protein 1; RING finger protein 119; TNF receptor-associated factor 7
MAAPTDGAESWEAVGAVNSHMYAAGSSGGSHPLNRSVSGTPGAPTDASSGHSGHSGHGADEPHIVRSTSLSELLPRVDGQHRVRSVAAATDARSVPGSTISGGGASGGGGGAPGDGSIQYFGMQRRSPSTVSVGGSSGGIAGYYDLDMRDTASTHSSTSRRTANSSVSSFPTMSRDLRKEEVCTVYTSAPNRRLNCVLCSKVYKDPVITTCGHTFCRRCCNKPSERCPIDNCPVSIVVANLAVSDQIAELMIHCKYGCKQVEGSPEEWKVDPEGCPVTIKLSQRRTHEQTCEYAQVRCPNSENCPVVLRKNLDEHLRVCEQKACPHAKYNCPFRGTQDQVREHLQTCRFEMLKDFLSEVHEKISRLQRQVRQKDEEITFLRTMLANVSDRLNMLEKNYEFRMERLDEAQAKLQREVTDYKSHTNILSNEVSTIASRTGMARDVQPFKCVGTFVGHEGPVWSLCTSGDLLYSGSSDNSIKVWGPVPTVWDPNSSYRCQRTLSGHTGIVLALTTWNDFLYSGGADNTIRIWRLDNFAQEATLHAHDNPVCTLAASRGMLFSGSLKIIRVWDTSQHTMVRELAGQNHWVRALVATDRYLYAGSYQSIKVWDLETFDTVQMVDVSGGSVYSLQVTNELLICGTYENSIHIWSLSNLEQTQKTTLTGHAGTVYALVVVESGGQQRLFSASYDRTIRVWNLDSMTCMQTLIRHQGSVSCLATMHGRLYSGAVDCSLKVWQ